MKETLCIGALQAESGTKTNGYYTVPKTLHRICLLYTSNMPIEYLSENKLYINMDLAKQLGIEIPADLAEKAIDVKV